VSASEKLKALDEGHTMAGLRVVPIYRKTGSKVLGADAFELAPDVQTVMHALPQIVAVVEAATEMSDWLEGMSCNTYGRNLIGIRDFDTALAALDEALK